MSMKFTVANWHTRPAEYWLDQPYAYTIMVSPPDWAKQHGMNQPLFAATASEVFGHIGQAEYTARFRVIMQGRLELVRNFIHAHRGKHVVLLCACPGSNIEQRFCHRYLVAKLLTWMGCEEVALEEGGKMA